MKKRSITLEFFQQPTLQIAQNLLGLTLARQLGKQTLRGVIVEVEAYLSARDRASHSYIGQTQRNASMFQKPGTCYVYSIHQQHCINVVTEPAGMGAAILIRGLEPVEGLDRMLANRNLVTNPSRSQASMASAQRATRGPGRLCSALAIDRGLDGIDLLTSSKIWLESRSESAGNFRIVRSKRIGVSKSVNRQLRYFIDGNQFVSGCARDHSRGRNSTLLHWPR